MAKLWIMDWYAFMQVTFGQSWEEYVRALLGVHEKEQEKAEGEE